MNLYQTKPIIPARSTIAISATAQCGPKEAMEIARKMSVAGQVECHVEHVGHDGVIGIATPTGKLIFPNKPTTNIE